LILAVEVPWNGEAGLYCVWNLGRPPVKNPHKP
jgi:hypothetical protein